MPDYRVYFLNDAGRISHRLDIACDDDLQALRFAREAHHYHGAELWQGGRFVGRVRPNPPPDGEPHVPPGAVPDRPDATP